MARKRKRALDACCVCSRSRVGCGGRWIRCCRDNIQSMTNGLDIKTNKIKYWEIINQHIERITKQEQLCIIWI